ncbi:heme o synthase [Arenimonas alkanexedens]
MSITSPIADISLSFRARTVLSLFKLRIGSLIMITAVVGMVVTPGRPLDWIERLVLALSVLVASASAGAFNQYYERKTDRLMVRTRDRAFASGAIAAGPGWLWLMGAMLAIAVGAAAWVLNPVSALFVFLGAFFYAGVYTVWLKRRSAWNIVIGGLAGSFAALAGAAAADPSVGPAGLILALVLLLWTPPHFWSLAIAYQGEYRAAGIPMLPVVVGIPRTARIVLASTIALVLASMLPMLFGAGPIYFAGAATGGIYFLIKARALDRAPDRSTAMGSFLASLLQLSLLLAGACLDSMMR